MLLREEQLWSCCARIYRNDAVRALLGESWHPGGLILTAQLARLVSLEPRFLALDVACGNGSSANFLATEFGCKVIGLDILTENAREAWARFAATSEFVVGESHRLPLAGDLFDVAMLECTLSSFQNKEQVIREINRVLKPNAKLGISDVVVNGDIPDELKETQFLGLCVAGALSIEQYSNLLERAGFQVTILQDRRIEAVEFVESIRKKLFVAQLLAGVGKISVKKETIEYAKRLAMLSQKSIEEDKLGYAAIVAQKVT